jgi:hypothetical protein
LEAGEVCSDGVVDLSGDVAVQTPDDVLFGQAFEWVIGDYTGRLLPREAVVTMIMIMSRRLARTGDW